MLTEYMQRKVEFSVSVWKIVAILIVYLVAMLWSEHIVVYAKIGCGPVDLPRSSSDGG